MDSSLFLILPPIVAVQIVVHPVNLTEIPDGDTVLLTCVASGDQPLNISWSREGSVLMNDSQRITIYEEEVEEGGTTFIQSILQICSIGADDAGVYSCNAENEASNDTATFELTVAGAPVQIVLHPVNLTEIPDGDTVLLTCVASGDQPLNISWSREGSVLMNDSQRITIYEEEVEEGGTTFIQSILQICSIGADDAGVYSCNAENEASNDTATFELTVAGAPVQIVLHPVNLTEIPDGDTVLLTCVATGDQPLNISWSREGSVLMNDSQRITIYEEEVEEGGTTFIQSILQICSIGADDAGVYSCNAENEASNDTATFELTVAGAPVQIVLHPVNLTEIPDGDTVLLTCVASGDQPLNISWSREGSVLMNDSQRITIYEEEVEEGGTTFIQSILQICSIGADDAGVYSCNAENEASNDTATFELTVAGAPVQIVLHPVNLTEIPDGDTVLLTCVASGDQPLNISWSREGSVLMNDSQRITIYEEEVEEGGTTFIQSILQICSIGADDAGVYSCNAENEASNDTATFELTVAGAPVQIVLHPVNLTEIPDGDTVLLTCVATGDQPLNISWSREGSVLMNDSQRITIYEEEVEEGGTAFIHSILQICSIGADDVGVYSCNAENEASNDTATFELTVAGAPVQIVLHPVNLTEIPDGDTVLLTCVASGDQPLNISWSREGSVLMNDSQRITIYEEEVEEGGTTFIQSILQICSIGADDAGVYSCNAENEASNDTATFELTVAGAPVQIVLHPVNLTEIPDGDTVLLTCVATGDQPLNISWSREGSVLMNDSQCITIYEEEVEEGGTTFIQSILQICSIGADDAGVYSCNAENEASNDTATFELTVAGAPVQIVLHPVNLTEIPDGDTVLLTCVASGDQPLNISWSREGSVLMNDSQRITIYEEEVEEGGTTFIQSILQICSIGADDAGVYSCNAENEASNDTATFELTVAGAPVQIVIHPVNLTEIPDGDTVLLTCVATGDQPLNISWSREGSVLMNDSQRITIYEEEVEEGGTTFIQSILQICSIGADNAGIYSCNAENEASNDTATFELTVAGAPVQIVLHPVNLTEIPDGDTVLLTCVASGDQPLNISWSREGSVLMNDSQRITIYEEEVEEGGTTFIQSILQICSIGADDAGIYSCNAENEASNDTSTFELTVAGAPVQIVVHPVNLTEIPDGNTVLLTCVASGDQPLNIYWSREGSVLMNDSQRITIYEEEVEEGGTAFIQSILQICSIGADDAGVYSCNAENEASNDTATFELTVAGAPVQIVLHPVNLTEIPDGDTVLLTCVASGDQPLNISWSREGSVLMNDSQRITIYEEEVEEGGTTFIQSILQICSIGADDAGVYSCNAENEASNNTVTFELTVTGAPVQIVLHPVNLTEIPDGDTVLLTCVATGDQPLNISWSREGSVLMNDSQRITIYEEEVEEGGTTFIQSILQICSIGADDAGAYRCNAENEASNDTATFELTVAGAPVQIVLHPVNLTEIPDGDTVLLTCVASGDQPLNISWSREGSVLMNDSQRITIYEEEVEEGGTTFIQSILQICSIGADDAGAYSCNAENEASNDTATFELTVAGAPVQIVLHPVNLTEIPDGDTVLLTCVATGDQPLNISWSREGSVLMNDSQRITIYEEEVEEGGTTFIQSILQICSIGADDAGAYRCNAENEASNDTATFELTVAGAPVQIVLHPVNLTEIPDGDTVLLTCVASGDQPLNISWSREGSVLMNDSQRITIYEEEVEEGGTTFIQSILQICSIGADDAGAYSCNAENESSNDTATFELTVAGAPVQVVLHPVNLTEIPDGDTVLLTCVASGDQPLNISWSREGSVLMNDSQRITIYEEEVEEGGTTFIQSILQICSIGADDAGIYSCNAENEASNDTATFELTVAGAPVQIVLHPVNLTEIPDGDTVLLTCVASGDQPLNISWSREGSALMNDSQRITIYEEEVEEGGTAFIQSILQICSIVADDAGVYSCNAENEASNDTATFELTVAGAPVQIVLHPVNLTEIPDGDTVLLTCVASGDQPLNISWSREGSVLMNDSQRITIYEEEVEEGGTTFIQSILQICSIGADDAGVYSCNAENEASNDTATFELTVAGAPVQIVLHPVNLTEIPDGDTVLLTCVATGDQPLNISWSREGSVLMNDSQCITIYEEEVEEGGTTFIQSILQICSIGADDAGVYSCNAENEASNDTATFELTVAGAPVQIVLHPVNLTEIPDGDTVLLTCVASGDQPLNISWSREGSVLMNDSQRITIYEEEVEEGGTTFIQSILQICSIGADDAGVYSCNAENEASNDTATFELTVAGAPVQIVIHPVNLTEIPDGDTVLLTCVATGDQPLNISWSREGSVLMNDSQRITIYEEEVEEGGTTFIQSILQICSIGADNAGIYSCNAENEASNDTATFELTVAGAPVQIVLHPVNLTEIPDGDTVLLTCVASGDQPLNISWSREGSVLMNDSQRITIYEEEVEEGGTTFIQSILQICSIGADDAGIYSCNAENEASNDTSTFELTVAGAPVQIVVHPVNLTEIPDGNTVLLTCVASGDQPLNIYWSREGSVLMNDSQRITIYEEEVEEGGTAFIQSILQICSIGADDAGVYSCNAENEASNDTATFELTVAGAPVQIVLHPVNLTEIPDGDTVLLTCVASGDQPLNISWSREGSVLMNDSQRITIYEEEVEEGGTTFIQSILQICSIGADDAGVYSCNAENEASNNTVTFELTVTGAPVQIVLHPVNLTEIPDGDTVLLTCVATGDQPLNISWSREGSVLMNDSQRITIYEEEVEEGGTTFIQSILQICSIGADDAGAYRCNAENEASNDTATFELTVAGAPVQIVLHPVNLTEIPDGDTVLLTCVASGDQPLNISWSREGSVLMNDSQRITIYEEEVEEGGTTFIQSILQICSIGADDAGAYSCNAENEASNDTATFELTVAGAPVQIVLHPVNLTEIPDGDTVLLTCVATGDQPLNISWSREGSVLMNDSQRITIYEEEVEEGGTTFIQSILQICSIGADDAGAYRCNAENEASNDTATFELTVAGAPVQIVLHPVNLTEIPDGDTVLLTCVASGDQPLNISWSREGSVLMNDSQRITIYEEEVEEGGTTFIQSILQICSIGADDAGAYSCNAENESSNDTATFELTVAGAPVQVVLHPVNLTEIPDGDTVLLTCVASGDQPLNISWSREGSVLMNDSQRITIYEEEVEEGGTTFIQSILQICSIGADDAGIYSCNAENEASNDTATFELTVAGAPVQIVLHPVNLTEIPDGDTVLLTCVASGDQPLNISWSREGSALMNDSQRITIYEEEVEEGGTAFIQSILQICSIVADDAGVYSCNAENEASNDTATFELTVTGAPVQIVLHPVNLTEIPDGDTVLLTCVASGDQPLNISWSREGSVLMNDSQRITIYEEEVEEGGTTFIQSILQICSIGADDAGVYSCNAENEASNDTATFELTVAGAPVQIVLHPVNLTEIPDGDTVLLICVATGDQPLNISWSREGSVLMNDSQRITIYEEEVEEGGTTFIQSILQICSIGADDAGAYSCNAENEASNDTATFELTVAGAPVQIVLHPVNLTEIPDGDTVLLTCVASGDQPLNISWSREGSVLMNDSQRITIYEEEVEEGGTTFIQFILQICSIGADDAGIYSCNAENEASNDTATFELTVAGAPVQIVLHPVNLTEIPDGDTVLLTCVASGDQPLNISWSREGSVLMNDSQRITIYEEEVEEGGTAFIQSILQICSIGTDDAGIYSCNAENEASNDTATFELTVAGAPVQIVLHPVNLTEIPDGDTVLLTCVATGDQPLNISWSREGSVLMNDSQRITIYEEEVEEGGTTFIQSILQICSIGADDAGVYSCNAENEASNDTVTFELTVAGAPVQIVLHPVNLTEIPDGDTVLLTCLASGDQPLNISWSREGSVLMNDSQRITIYEEEVEEGGTTFIQSILQICSIGADDAGVYSCNAENEASNDTATFELTVAGAPVQIVLRPVNLTEIPDGDTVLLTCVATGDQPLNISWSREGSVLMNDSQRITIYEEEVEEGGTTFIQSILQICSIGADDAGVYSCNAENEASNDTATFELTVAGAPVQIVLHPVNLTEIPDGDTVLLTCVATGDQPLNISWSREGSVLMNDFQRITIYEEEVEEGGTTFIQSILQICSIGADDAGVYRCNAENEASNDTATFELTVAGAPVQIVLHPVNLTEIPDGDTVLLTCVASGDQPLNISWSREGSVLMNDSQRITIYEEEAEEGGTTFIQSILQICSIGADDAGAYSCNAENEASNDTATFKLTVAGAPVQIVLHPVNLTEIPDGDTVLLTCVASGDQPLNISWSREGSVLMNDSQRITIYEEEVEEGGTTFIQSILQICSIGADDAGIYSCNAENEASNDTATFELTVAGAPVQIVLHPVNLTEIPDGDTVLLTCVASGDQPLNISWSREGSVLMNDSQRITIYEEEVEEGGTTFIQSILQICSIGADDAGVYSCNAENEASNDTANFELTVAGAPVQIVLHPVNLTEIPDGDTVLLTCVATGDQPLNISWSREGSVLMNDSQRITIYEEEVEEGGTTFIQSILQICSIGADDAGVYSCNAENEASNDTANFELTVAGAPVQIVLHPVNLTEIPDGDTVLLTCVATGDQPLNISWSREGSVLMNDSQRITIYEEEVEEGGTTFIQSILQICSIGADDAGVYSCNAENEASNDTATFELTVAGAPVQIVLHPVNLTEIPDGDTVLLTCVASGDQPLNISWSREGSVLMNDSQRITIYEEEVEEGGTTFIQSILQICSIRADDAGVYSCNAENEASNDTANFELTVAGAPVQIVLHPVNLTEIPDGDTVLLTCVATGDQPLNISWSREGSVLMNDSQRITIYEEEVEEGGTTFIQSILQICSIGADDAGVYRCNAENEASNDTATFELTVAGAPVQIVLHPVNVNLTEIPDGDTVLLTCVASGDQPLNISWSREGSVLMNDSQRITIYEEEVEEGGTTFIQSILQICSIGTDDAGVYSCNAENEASNDTATFELTVAGAPVQIVLHPVNLTEIPDGDTVLLTCVASGDQPLNISWSREGSVLMNDSQRITTYEEEVEEGGTTFIQSILQICSIGADDAGIYSCNAENEASNDTATFELTVAGAPVQIVLHPVNLTEIPDGNTVLLTCVASGDQPLNISWSREGSVLMNDSQRITIYEEEVEEGGTTFIQSILQICSIGTDDAGVYSCNADNEASNDTATFELTVAGAPVQIVLHPVNLTEIPDGDTVLLTCVASGDQPLNISWSREGSVLMNDSQRITIYEEEVEEGGTTFIQSILQICSIGADDAGIYSCNAENEASNDTATFELTVAGAPVQIVLHPVNLTEIPDGNTVLLTCVASGDQPLNISWSREGSVLMNDSQRITFYEEEVEEGGTTFIQSILQICSIGADDAGVYSCNAENGASNDTATFELTVAGAPVQIVLHPVNLTEIPDGDTVLLTCVATGDQPLNISWSREGSVLMNDSQRITIYEEEVEEGGTAFIQSILQICSMGTDDAGVYSCNAENEASNDTATFELTVAGAPVQIVLHPVNLTEIPDGDTVLLTCVASGDQPLNISWSREGSVLMNDSQRITIYEEEVEEGGTTFIQSILQICSIGADDAGIYSCNAENEASNDTATLELTVAGAPVQIVLRPVNLTEIPDGDTVLLTCVASGDQPLNISWSREGSVLMNDSQRITIYEEEVEEGGIVFVQSILQICSAESDDAGIYNCTAENDVDNVTANFELTVDVTLSTSKLLHALLFCMFSMPVMEMYDILKAGMLAMVLSLSKKNHIHSLQTWPRHVGQ